MKPVRAVLGQWCEGHPRERAGSQGVPAVASTDCIHLGKREPIERDRRRCALDRAPGGLVTCCNVVKPGEWSLGKECGPGCDGYQAPDHVVDANKMVASVSPKHVYRSLPAEAASQAIRLPGVKRAAWWAVAGEDERYYRYLRYSVESFLRCHTGWAINIVAPANRIASLAAVLPQATLHALRPEDILPVPGAVEDYNRQANGSTYAIYIPTAATRLRMIADNPDDTTFLYTDCDVVYRRSIESLAMQFEGSGCAFAIAPEVDTKWAVTNEMHWRGDAWRSHFKRPEQWEGWPCLNTGLMLARGGRSSSIAAKCYELMKSPLYHDMKFGEQSSLTCAIWDDEQPFFRILPSEHVISKNEPHHNCIAQHYCGTVAKSALDREIGRDRLPPAETV